MFNNTVTQGGKRYNYLTGGYFKCGIKDPITYNVEFEFPLTNNTGSFDVPRNSKALFIGILPILASLLSMLWYDGDLRYNTAAAIIVLLLDTLLFVVSAAYYFCIHAINKCVDLIFIETKATIKSDDNVIKLFKKQAKEIVKDRNFPMLVKLYVIIRYIIMQW